MVWDMKLTIGMPVYDDFNGIWFSVQALRLYHAEAMSDCEILVIDNHPNTPQGKATRGFIDGWAQGCARYVEVTEAVGTAFAKNQVFAHAHGDAVLCMDCHVLLGPGSVRRLIDFYDQHPSVTDLYCGTLVYDNLINISNDFNDEWSSEMWGTWATNPVGEDPEAEPFEIKAQGKGLFTCKRDAWLGFNQHFRGFGGEEFYLEEKYRRCGHRVMCLPWLRWHHRFGRPEGVPYPLRLFDKARNYLIGHVELGLSQGRLYEHFVTRKKISEQDWKNILAEAANLRRPGLGDMVKRALACAGITEERVSRWIGRPCGCAERQERLNELGRWAIAWLSGKEEPLELGEQDELSTQ